MKTRFWSMLALATVLASVGSAAQKSVGIMSDGDPPPARDTGNPIADAMNAAEQFRQEIGRIKQGGDPFHDGQYSYERMVARLSIPATLSHLPFPEEDSSREWTVDAERVAKGIKPKINYQVLHGDSAIYFQGTPTIQQNLKDNVRVIAWYREQIDKVCPSEQEATGPHALARLIDAFLDKFAEAVPQVTVRMNGTMNEPTNQKIEYSRREVWEMLSTINRYFFYKVQIHDEQVPEYLPADQLLMGSLVRTAAIYGATPPPEGLSKIDTKLKPDAPDWRADAYQALNSWAELQKSATNAAQPVGTIKIPVPQPPQTVAAPTDPNAFPPDVEDVKELGGQIFIKRKGFWSQWSK